MLREFAEFLEHSRKSTKTIENYVYDIRALLQKSRGNLCVLDLPNLTQWINDMERSGRTTSTICRKVAAVRQFCAFAVGRGLIAENTARLLALPQRTKVPMQYLQPERAQALLYLGPRDSMSARDNALVALAVGAGLRATEILGLQRDHVTVTGEQVVVISSGRRVQFQGDLARALREYLPQVEGGPLFPRYKKGPAMTRQGIWKALRRRSELAGLHGITPRRLRAAYIHEVLREDKNDRNVIERLNVRWTRSVRQYRTSE